MKQSNESKKKKVTGKTFILFIFFEIILIVLYAFCTEYSQELSISTEASSQAATLKYYPFFQDIHIMIFIGFGFLMVFLKSHSWTSVCLNFLVATLAVQLCILSAGFWHCVMVGHWEAVQLDIRSLVVGDFGAGAVLITYGVLLGKVNANQLLVIGFIESLFYGLAESFCVTQYKAVDMGGSMYVHTFGAYYGLACSFVLTDQKLVKQDQKAKYQLEGGNYNSQLLAMVGTLFLWCYWPSFNGVFAEGNSQMRVIVNTTIALSASCIAAFATSSLFDEKGRFDMEDILNATLAGGVIVGSTSDMMNAAWCVLILGGLGGIISVVGFHKFKMERIHDTCGVNNLHGIPGLIGGISGAVLAWVLNEDGIESIFGEMGTEGGRTAAEQGWFQLAALGTVFVVAIVGGLIGGGIAKLIPGPNPYFSDHLHFHGIEEHDDTKL